MRKATKYLIESRNRAGALSPVKLVSVTKQPDTVNCAPQECFDNAYIMANKNNLQVVSGWLVGKMNVHGFAFMFPHWWNYDPVSKVHIDYTPFSHGWKYDYVLDEEFQVYCSHYEFTKNIGMLHPDGIWVEHKKGRYYPTMSTSDGKLMSIEGGLYEEYVSSWDMGALYRQSYILYLMECGRICCPIDAYVKREKKK